VQFDIEGVDCIGSGECVLTAPEVFQMGDDGIAIVLDAAPTVDDDTAAALVRNCPGAAIRLAGA
jgi:ferredoxin